MKLEKCVRELTHCQRSSHYSYKRCCLKLRSETEKMLSFSGLSAIIVWIHKALHVGGHLLDVLRVGAGAHSRRQRQLTIRSSMCQAPFILAWRLHNVVIKILVSRLAPLLGRASHCLAGGWDSAGTGWRGEGIKG